jgi:hypothetical protein
MVVVSSRSSQLCRSISASVINVRFTFTDVQTRSNKRGEFVHGANRVDRFNLKCFAVATEAPGDERGIRACAHAALDIENGFFLMPFFEVSRRSAKGKIDQISKCLYTGNHCRENIVISADFFNKNIPDCFPCFLRELAKKFTIVTKIDA